MSMPSVQGPSVDPVIGAPLFIFPPDLVIAQCKAGISIVRLNARVGAARRMAGAHQGRTRRIRQGGPERPSAPFAVPDRIAQQPSRSGSGAKSTRCR